MSSAGTETGTGTEQDRAGRAGTGGARVLYEGVSRAGAGPRALGIVSLVALTVSALPSMLEGYWWLAALTFAAGAVLFAGLWGLRLRVVLDDEALHLRGSPFFGRARTVPRSQITAAAAGYHLDGVGFGWGRRWEGRGQHMWRASGPEVTVRLTDGNLLAFSVPDPDAFLAALDAPVLESTWKQPRR